jgi:hypothetical protein
MSYELWVEFYYIIKPYIIDDINVYYIIYYKIYTLNIKWTTLL